MTTRPTYGTARADVATAFKQAGGRKRAGHVLHLEKSQLGELASANGTARLSYDQALALAPDAPILAERMAAAAHGVFTPEKPLDLPMPDLAACAAELQGAQAAGLFRDLHAHRLTGVGDAPEILRKTDDLIRVLVAEREALMAHVALAPDPSPAGGRGGRGA